MITRRSFRWLSLTLSATCLAICFVSHNADTQSQSDTNSNATVKRANGLTVATFILKSGTITVNLPADMAAGDTISGTVVEQPKGQTKEERAMNRAELTGLVLEINGKPVEFFTPTPKERESTIPQTFWIYHDETKPSTPTGTPVPTSLANSEEKEPLRPISREMATTESGGTARFSIALIKPPQQELGRATIPYFFEALPGVTPSGAIITHGDSPTTPTFRIPSLGQAGRSIPIFGPFDGDSSNTTVKVGEQDSPVLAESPRQIVVAAPTNVVGATQIQVKDGSAETTSPFRNLKIDLTAPKTSLLKGESTELHVQVEGLEGLKTPVPLTLEAHGVITMVGGLFQPLTIQPSQVGADGRYSTTRGITGVQAGGWEATATVETHAFNFCLQDDKNAKTVILINSFTGDYIFFCPGCASSPGQTGGQKEGSTGQVTPRTVDMVNWLHDVWYGFGFNSAPPGNGTVTMKGCTITLEHNAPDRHLKAQIDQCAKTGNASVQTSSPKMKFTITDWDMTNNTCVCGPACK